MQIKAHLWKFFLLLILYCTMQWQLYQMIYPKLMEGFKDIYDKCHKLSFTTQRIQIVLGEEEAPGLPLRATDKSSQSWAEGKPFGASYHQNLTDIKIKQKYLNETLSKLQFITHTNNYSTISNTSRYGITTRSDQTQTLGLKSKGEEILVVGYNYVTAGHCIGGACTLNQARKPEKLGLRLQTGENCSIQSCATAIVKSKNGLKSLRMLVDSVNHMYPGLKFVIIDDFNTENLKKFTEKPLGGVDQVLYIQVPPNVGVGYGRNIALQLVQTKYFIYLDDDFYFRNETSLDKMLSLLEGSDIALVAGKVTCCGGRFEGVLRVASSWNISDTKTPETYVYHFPGIAYSVIPGYNYCYRVDIAKNFFMAKKHDVIMAGGWDSDRKLFEHEDFFLRLTKSRAKIVYCEDVAIDHVPSSERSSWEERIPFFAKYNDMFKQKWKVNGFRTCRNKTSYFFGYENVLCPLKAFYAGSPKAISISTSHLVCQFVLLAIFMDNLY